MLSASSSPLYASNIDGELIWTRQRSDRAEMAHVLLPVGTGCCFLPSQVTSACASYSMRSDASHLDRTSWSEHVE
jgi:hypothetical protein